MQLEGAADLLTGTVTLGGQSYHVWMLGESTTTITIYPAN